MKSKVCPASGGQFVISHAIEVDKTVCRIPMAWEFLHEETELQWDSSVACQSQ
jgi:hypothetical protein